MSPAPAPDGDNPAPAPAPTGKQISDAEWELFADIRWRHLHFNGHFCAAQTAVFPPRCFSQGGHKHCYAGEPLCDYHDAKAFCSRSALNSIAFDCRLWRAARSWNANAGMSDIKKLKASGIYKELKKTKIYDDPKLMSSIHKWGFRVEQCCSGCSDDPFRNQMIVGVRPGNTTGCMQTGNPFYNVTKLAAVANVGGCFVQLFSFDSWVPNPKNQGDWQGKLPMETIDQSCIPDKYKDDPQLPPLCSGRKEDFTKCKRPPGPKRKPWTPGKNPME